MEDPLSKVISLLRPQMSYSKLVHASNPFRIHREDISEVFYCMLLDGHAYLQVEGKEPIKLKSGDFTLVPALKSFSFSSIGSPLPMGESSQPILGKDGIYRIGNAAPNADVQVIVGHCRFASANADLLISLLPNIVVVPGEDRLGTLAALLQEEVRADRPARNAIIEHLLQVLLIEALRSTGLFDSAAGLLRGLADARISIAIRAIHSVPNHPWTIAELAKGAGLSRSAFFARFNKIVGVTPMSYLLNWRMALAKHLLREGPSNIGITEVSDKIGYGSASAFSTAFTRHVGHSPGSYSKAASTAEVN